MKNATLILFLENFSLRKKGCKKNFYTEVSAITWTYLKFSMKKRAAYLVMSSTKSLFVFM